MKHFDDEKEVAKQRWCAIMHFLCHANISRISYSLKQCALVHAMNRSKPGRGKCNYLLGTSQISRCPVAYPHGNRAEHYVLDKY